MYFCLSDKKKKKKLFFLFNFSLTNNIHALSLLLSLLIIFFLSIYMQSHINQLSTAYYQLDKISGFTSCSIQFTPFAPPISFCASAMGITFEDNVRYGQSVGGERYFGIFEDGTVFFDIVRDANNASVAYPISHYLYSKDLLRMVDITFFNYRSFVSVKWGKI